MPRVTDITALVAEKWRLAAVPRDVPVLVGVSGGLDSVVLLDVLVAAGWPVLVAHVDHGLRGKESAADARFVRGLAAAHGFPARVSRVDVAALAASGRISLESAGRMARRTYFARLAVRNGLRVLALAHHADDQAETVLWNLARGAGLRGAGGMAEEEMQEFPGGRRLRVMRPLIGLRRSELLVHAQARGLVWREDASNGEPAFTRNRIRQQVLPALERAAGRDAIRALGRFAALARDDERLLCDLADEALAGARQPDGSLDVPVLRGMPGALLRRVVRRWLMDAGVPRVGQCEAELAAALAMRPGAPARVNLPGGHHVCRRNKRLILLRA